MYKKVIFFLCLLSQSVSILPDDILPSTDELVVLDHGKNKENLFDFKYDQKDLKDILNSFAKKKGINIMYSEADPLASQVTFDAGRKVSLKTAWELTVMLLDKAGFSLLPRGQNLYVLVANSALNAEQVPLYIDVHFSSLPNSAEKIRYMFYLENVQLSSQKNAIDSILKTIFPSKNYNKTIIYDAKNNGIIFTGKSSLIRSAMLIINALDEPGYKEQIKLFNLKYTGAADVVTILNSLLQNSTTPKRGYISKKSSTTQATYFEVGTKVISLDPNNIRKVNTLIVFGKSREVAKVVDFIKKHIDIPQEDGAPFYHVVDLKHVKASDVKSYLTSLVSGGKSFSSQSTGSMNSDLGFDSQTSIIAESIGTGSSNLSGANSNMVQRGGNRLIISANKRDWIRIKQLIEDLDQPQKQVIIEALVLDLDIDFTRQLSSQIRTRGLAPSIFPKYLQAQAGMLASSQLQSTTDYTQLLGNLNKILDISDIRTNASVVMVDGGTQANGVWAFFQLLSQHTNVKVTTRPFVTARNNQTAEVTSTVSKYLVSNVSTGAAATVNYTPQEAAVTIKFTPLISENNEINLQNDINVTYWNGSDDSQASNQKNKRTLTNNVSMRSGDVLILGGLTRSKVNISKNGVPVLSKIPVLGHLFSSRTQTTEKDQLFILIRPTIIEPRIQGGMGSMTRAASRLLKTEINQTEATFANLKDPINRWFYGSNSCLREDFDNSLTRIYESDGITKKNPIDARYKQKIKSAEPRVPAKQKAVEKTESEKEQQQSSNILQYKLHQANNPFGDKKSKQKSKKSRRRKKT